MAKGIYKGVEFHDYPSAGAGSGLENFIVNEAIGTDFALQFARSVSCARLPVTEPMLHEVIAFLNDKNREYAEGEADYNWSVWADNCAHTLRNALAAANIWSPLSVRAVKFRQLFNLAVSANEFVNLAELGSEGNIDDYREVQSDGSRRDALHEFDWLPTRHGALLKTLPVHEPNDLYDTTFRLFTLQSPFRMGKTQHAIDLLSDDRFVNLAANLHYFRDKYEAVLASHDERHDMLTSVRGTPYRRVERLFYEYLKAQRSEVEAMLAKLPELEDQSDTPRTKQRSSRDPPAGLEISQDRITRCRCREMFQCVSPKNISGRKHRLVGEFERLGEQVEHPGDNPIACADVLTRIQQKKQYYRDAGKELNPEVEPQIVAPAP
jgi:hypothetical protein